MQDEFQYTPVAKSIADAISIIQICPIANKTKFIQKTGKQDKICI